MKKYILWLILTLIISGVFLGVYFYRNQIGEVVISNFVESGVSAKNLPGKEDGRIYLVYEKPGQPGLFVPLKIVRESICGDGVSKSLCTALNVADFGLYNGRPIKVSGNLKDGELIVNEIAMGNLKQ